MSNERAMGVKKNRGPVEGLEKKTPPVKSSSGHAKKYLSPDTPIVAKLGKKHEKRITAGTHYLVS